MAESFDFSDTTHFTVGAIGQPGSRTFFLQAGDRSRFVSVKLEKQQVAGLAAFLSTVLDDLPAPSNPEPVALFEPALPEWVVGRVSVGVDEAIGEIVIVVEELVFEDDEDEDDEDFIAEDPGLFDPEFQGATLRVRISSSQAAAFVASSELLMKGGRPPCRLCGQPVDPNGHACPRLN